MRKIEEDPRCLNARNGSGATRIQHHELMGFVSSLHDSITSAKVGFRLNQDAPKRTLVLLKIFHCGVEL